MKDIEERIEIKYRISKSYTDILLNNISYNNFLIRTFKDRIVNSLYLDTHNFSTAQMNLDGMSKRKKYRIRYYGDIINEVEKKINLEIKIKNNNYGSKVVKENFYTFKRKARLTFDNFKSKILDKIDNISLQSLNITLQVKYLRSYYQLINGVRITVDRNILFKDPENNFFFNTNNMIDYDYDVIGIKSENENKLSKLLKNLNLRQTRHSKYLAGLELINKSIY